MLVRSFIITLALLAAPVVRAAHLHIQVVDEARKPLWTRMEVRGADGKMYRAADAIFDKRSKSRPESKLYYLDSFIVNGEAHVEVPGGSYTVIVEHGLEYERGEKQVEVS